MSANPGFQRAANGLPITLGECIPCRRSPSFNIMFIIWQLEVDFFKKNYLPF